MSWGSFALGTIAGGAVGLGLGAWAALQILARALDVADVPVPRLWSRRP